MFIRFLYQVSDLHIQAEAETHAVITISCIVATTIGRVIKATVVIATPISARVSITAASATRIFRCPFNYI